MIKICRLGILIIMFLLIISNYSIEASHEGIEYDIQLDIKENGDLLVEEKITYGQKQGVTAGQRKLSKKDCNNLKFISLETRDTVILEKKIKEGKEIVEIKWRFLEGSDDLTFILKYKIIGGIKTLNNKNVFTYKMFAGGKHPITEIYLTINFPEKFAGSKVYPQQDLVKKEDKVIKMHHRQLSPEEEYKVQILFDKIINLGINIPTFHLPALLIGLTLGAVVILYDIFNTINNGPDPMSISVQLKELNYIEKGLIYYPKSRGWQKGIIAAIFSLAHQNKIKLIIHLKKTLWGTYKKQVKIKVLNDKELTAWEEQLLVKIQGKKHLKKFFKDKGLKKEILKANKNNLIKKGIFSQKHLTEKKHIYISGFLLLIPGLIFLAMGYWLSLFPLLGLGYFFLTLSLGRFIKRLFLPQLTPGGLYLQEQLEAQTDEAKKSIEKRLEKAPTAGYYRLIRELPRLILHHNFNISVLNKYLQYLFSEKEISYPAWFEIDLSSISNTTLNDIEPDEKLEYMFLGIIQGLNQLR